MKLVFRARALACALCLPAAGCTSLKEIPPSQYASEPEREHVRMLTRDSLEYEFDYISVDEDSLTGYRRQEVKGPVEQYSSVKVPLGDVMKLSARRLDWYRTGLIGGTVITALVVKGLASANDSGEGDTSGGGGERPPR
jgi:hypothetical protein